MNSARLFVMVGLCMGMASPVFAQGERESPIGSHVARGKPADAPDVVRMSHIDRARATLDRYADCIVTDNPRKAVQYRNMMYDDPQTANLLSDMVSDDCLRRGELKIPMDLLRGAIFKNFYQREQKNQPIRLAEVPINFTTYLKDAKAPDSMRYLVLMNFGGCVVRADPTHTSAFLTATPGSTAEKNALAALRPALGPCFPTGAQVKLSKSVLSAVLAEALYREAQAGQATLAEVSR